MIDDVYQGRLALAYNVLGSYAENRLAHEPGITIVPMQDYVTVMMRTCIYSAKRAKSGCCWAHDRFSIVQTHARKLGRNNWPAAGF
jgi:iron(III) transport system substrate-binding protein